jgi:hypothetical protein
MMKFIWTALLAVLLLSGLTATASAACKQECCAVCTELPTIQSVRITINVGDAISTGVHTLVAGLKHGAHFLGDLPRETRHQVAANSPHVRHTVRHVADRTQDIFQQLSVEVTSLSLQILRSAFSSIWALLSGLLLS